ncbi:hypothetical protein RHGRI_014439 [Rhododendron griersonianum]|uniref:Uncharacterized protein n=1 Tax=Rhododendron griersonianum TaxID=479676 RepID=A0AAV6K9M7_9ERIC|nr:hypothetical protein RHGRI_014439 [Rhododendron griersonianum]
MKEENPHVCRALSVTRKDSIAQSKTTLSSFINITFPQPKIRIKLPKLLAKTLRRRNPKKYRNVTGNANDSKNNNNNNNNRSTKPGNIFSKRVGSIVSNVFGNKKPAAKSNGRKDEIGNEETGEAKMEAKAPLLLPENFNERNGKQVSSSNLIRVSNRKVRRGRSVRKKEIADRAEGNENEGEKEEEEERGEEEELCKKRILMGQKCRPLHQSGVLRYDGNGVLLPEVDYLCQEL